MSASTVTLLIVSWAAGLVLGAFYFLALWHTVRRLPGAASPGRLMLMSFAVRSAVALAGFYLLARDGHWERLALAMVGFWMMRKILTMRLGTQKVTVEA